MILNGPSTAPLFRTPVKPEPAAAGDGSRSGTAVETVVDPAAGHGARRVVVRHLESGRVLARIPTLVDVTTSTQKPRSQVVDLRV